MTLDSGSSPPRPDGRPVRARAESVQVLLFFLTFYLLTLSNNLSIAHDSVIYLNRIAAMLPSSMPNHLIYEPLLTAIYWTVSVPWPTVNAQHLVEGVNAVAGAFALQAGYLIAARRLGLNRVWAAAATAAAGFSFGVWYYSVAVEIYVPPLALLAWCFFWISRPDPSLGTLISVAVAHSLATLVHQSAVLFAVVPTLAIFWGSSHPMRGRCGRFLLYGLVATIVVGGAYISAGIYLHKLQSLGDFVSWLEGHGTKARYWSVFPKAFFEAAVGFGRAFLGGHFVFAIDSLSDRLATMFADNDLADEMYMVRNLRGPKAFLLCALAVSVTMGIAAIAVAAAANCLRGRVAATRRPFVLLAAWFLTYIAFFLNWDAANVDFWVVQVFLFWYVAAAAIYRPGAGFSWGIALVTGLATGQLILGAISTVGLAHDPENDYYRVQLRSVERSMKSGDLLVIGDSWPISHQIDYFLKIEAIYVTEEYTKTTPRNLLARVAEKLNKGQRVFAAPDLFTIRSATRRYYGQSYLEFLDQFTNGFCGSEPVEQRHPYEMELRLITCTKKD